MTQLHVENVNVHPYHHHTQPYQIVALDNDSAAMDASWRVSLRPPEVSRARGPPAVLKRCPRWNPAWNPFPRCCSCCCCCWIR